MRWRRWLERADYQKCRYASQFASIGRNKPGIDPRISVNPGIDASHQDCCLR
jgi:hypothetical protein